jgi:hypothetical protein
MPKDASGYSLDLPTDFVTDGVEFRWDLDNPTSAAQLGALKGGRHR